MKDCSLFLTIMYMYKKICITNRHLVSGDFMTQIKRILETDVDMLILREKDMSEPEYTKLASGIIRLCRDHHKKCILHSFIGAAKELSFKNIHLSMQAFCDMTDEDRAFFDIIGVSTHTVEEAILAEKLGASYITASHIFPTECKKGLSPKGLKYLKETAASVDIDVYALGGINAENAAACIAAGADGICMMSEYMRGENI